MAPARRVTHTDKCYYMQMILIPSTDLTESMSFNDRGPGITMTSSQGSMTEIKGRKNTVKDLR